MKLQLWEIFGLIVALAVTAGADLYVSPAGDDANSGASWAEALATISNAVEQAGAGDAVFVSNGVYDIADEIIITHAITVTGVGGADTTQVRRTSGAGRIFQMTHADAVLEGFAISGGSITSAADKRGGGVLMTAGLLRDCVISNNIETVTKGIIGAGLHLVGGIASNIVVCQNRGYEANTHGVYVKDALLVDSVVRDNNRSSTGAAIYRGSYASVNVQANGEVRNCRIVDNANGTSTFCHGGGVAVEGGILRGSVIANNVNSGSSNSEGGGVSLISGLVENCLIVSNACDYMVSGDGGGGVYQAGGVLVNCTIAHNASAVSALAGDTRVDIAGGFQWVGGIVSNAIVFGNTRLGGQAASDISGEAGFASAFYNSCSPSLTDGDQGNITADPRFCDASVGDFRLRADSPCRDAGGLQGPMVDLLGAVRPQDGTGDAIALSDMGAYEAEDVNGALNCYFAVDAREAFTTHTAEFTAKVFGTNTSGLYYRWDFGNGTQEGAGLAALSRNFTEMGRYDVSLVVSNDTEEVAQWTWLDCIRVGAPTAYVALDGAHQSPYDTWAKAATNILAAVEAAVVTPAGATHVIVSNGTYHVRSSAESIYIGRGITVSGLGGASETIVAGVAGADVYPNFDLDHPDAVVEGFASQTANFGAIVSSGTLRNCILRNNTGKQSRNYDSGYGCGLRMYGGLAEACKIVNNTSDRGTGACGAGVWMTGPSVLLNSVIATNTIPGSSLGVFAAGVRCRDYMSRPVVRNCLIMDNVTTLHPLYGGCAAVHLSGGRLENCTVVSNRVATWSVADWKVDGAGLSCVSGSVSNTVVWGNTIETNSVTFIDDLSVSSIPFIAYSCAPELTPGVRGNISDDPLFVDPSGGNYRLADGSPCINAGSNLDWMGGALDLDGLSRVNAWRVDMGAYESISPPGAAIFIR